MKGMYQNIAKQWEKPTKEIEKLQKERLIEWRKQHTVERIDKPTRLDRARALGYKAKQGFVLARVKVKKGGRRRRLYGRKGRKPSKSGLVHFTPKSLQWIAEEKVQKKFPNLEVLNSYYAAEDGVYKWFECVLIDPSSPSIKSDSHVNWILNPANRRRVLHGLTSSAKKARGLK